MENVSDPGSILVAGCIRVKAGMDFADLQKAELFCAIIDKSGL